MEEPKGSVLPSHSSLGNTASGAPPAKPTPPLPTSLHYTCLWTNPGLTSFYITLGLMDTTKKMEHDLRVPRKGKSSITELPGAPPPQQVLEEVAPLQGPLLLKHKGLGGTLGEDSPQETPRIHPQKVPRRAAIPPAKGQELQDYFVALQRVGFLQLQVERPRLRRLRDLHRLPVAVQDVREAGGVQACQGRAGQRRVGAGEKRGSGVWRRPRGTPRGR